MKNSLSVLHKLSAKIEGASSAQKQELFRKIVAVSKGLKPKIPQRPRLGERGVSGPRGSLFKRGMIQRLGSISNNKNGPNYELAKKLNTILLAAREDQIIIESNSVEHQALVNVMNAILKAQGENRRISLTPLQQRVLNSFRV